MGDKFPVNKTYKGKYSGSAGRNWSSGRASMSSGGGGKGPVNKSGGKKRGCPLWVLIWVISPAAAITLGITMIIDSLFRL